MCIAWRITPRLKRRLSPLLDRTQLTGQILFTNLFRHLRHTGSHDLPPLTKDIPLAPKGSASPPGASSITLSQPLDPAGPGGCPRIATSISDDARSTILLHTDPSRWDAPSARAESHEESDKR